jgi:hypothetical protein
MGRKWFGVGGGAPACVESMGGVVPAAARGEKTSWTSGKNEFGPG